jgi:hypothetical protein
MKHLIPFPIFIFSFLISFSSFSQTYKVDELRIYSWDDTAVPADWNQDFVEQYTYENGGNKETSSLGLSFPGMDKLYKHIKTYNANNDIIKDVFQFWNATPPGIWESFSQTVYSYDGLNLEYITRQLYVSGVTFVNSSREWLEYSGSYTIRQTDQTWNGANWVNDEKTEITNNGSGMPIEAFYSLYDSVTTMDWLAPYEKDTATYINGLLMEVITEDLTNGDLDRSTYMYSSGLLTELLFEQSLDGGANYTPYDREFNSYDTNGNNTVLVFEDNNTGSWVKYFKEEKDFSIAAPFSLSAESFNKESFKVFPNPASDVINVISTIGIDRIELFDISGKKVVSTSQNKQINIKNIKSGLYVLKVFNNNIATSKKLVIR